MPGLRSIGRVEVYRHRQYTLRHYNCHTRSASNPGIYVRDAACVALRRVSGFRSTNWT
jgi:hypothetical protein